MKKINVRNLVFATMMVVMLVLTGIVCISVSNAKEVKENALEEIERKVDILDEYGYEGYKLYTNVETEFKKEGNLGVGTYEFYYVGDHLHLEAESINGLHWTMRW